LPAIRASAQSAADYVIGPQDVLTINIFDQADLGGKYTVEADGTFSFPMIGRVRAGGMTLRGFETELKKKLADGYFKNPQVTVAVEQYGASWCSSTARCGRPARSRSPAA
jgi:polysaccharide export outer membrane protein